MSLKKWKEPFFFCCILAFSLMLPSLVSGFSLKKLLPQKHREEPESVRYGLSVRRNEVLDVEEKTRMGYSPNVAAQKMTSDESLVNDIISDFKDAELSRGFNNSANFLASHHFFRVKEKIEQSEVFKLIKMMPKGALLHGHNTALVSSQWFIRNITYRQGIIMYTTDQNVLRFTFRQPKRFDWKYVADARKAASNVESFDRQLESHINLYTPQPEIDYPDIDVVWDRFQKMFETVKEAITYYPVYVDYHVQMLQEMLNDNIMYAEIRTGASPLYDDDGRIYSSFEAVQTLQNVVANFKDRNPQFFGAKIIYTAHRNADPKYYEDINNFRQLQ